MNLIAQDTCLTSNVPYGYCQCTCGGKTNIAKQNQPKYGHVKGEPYPYIFGHGSRKKKPPLDTIPFLFEGELCRKIPLTRGLFALVNQTDYDFLMQWAWWATPKSKRNKSCYAVRQEYNSGSIVLMHRLLLNAPNDTGVDHRNLNGLDNRRSNLRLASSEQNKWNTGLTTSNKSGYKGVSALPNGKWRAGIRHKGVSYHLGCFDLIKDAADAYIRKAIELRGEFARA